MGVESRKEKTKEINRAEIVDAAEKLFFAQGYEATTMSEVAEEAEFSKRTLYVYFDSKQQLYLAVIIRAFEQFIKLIEQNLEAKPEQDGWAKIETMGRSFLELYQEYPDYFKAIANYETKKEDFSSDDQLMEVYYQKGEQAFEFLTAALKDGMADGSIRQDIDVTDTALVLWANIMGVNSLVAKKKAYVEEYHHRKVEEIIAAMFDFAKRSIKK